MDERDRERQSIDAQPEGTGRLRAGVGVAQAREPIVCAKPATGCAVPEPRATSRIREAGSDAAFGLREAMSRTRPGSCANGASGRRGQVRGSSARGAGSGSSAVARSRSARSSRRCDRGGERRLGLGRRDDRGAGSPAAPAPVVKPPRPRRRRSKAKAPTKPTGPTLHGAAPDFSAGEGREGRRRRRRGGREERQEADGGDDRRRSGGTRDGRQRRGGGRRPRRPPATRLPRPAPSDAAASTAKIGATPQASASRQRNGAQTLDATGAGVGLAEKGAGGSAGRRAGRRRRRRSRRRVASPRRSSSTRSAASTARSAASFRHTSTKQLSRALLHRPPRQPAAVKVPRAKVVNVVAGPSKDGVYPVSVSLLRVGVTSELRLELEQGVGKKWQVTNVLG